MITTTQQPTTTYQKQDFVPVDYLPVGTGEVGRYQDDVEGILVGLKARDGVYLVKDKHGNPVIDPKTGRQMERPNSWTAYFEDGSMWSWPTYLDDEGVVRPWSRFDPSIILKDCIQQRRVIHVWKDAQNFCHLELVETTNQGGINPSVEQAAQLTQPQPQLQQPMMATSFAPLQQPQQVAQQFVPQQQTAPQQQAQAYRMPWD